LPEDDDKPEEEEKSEDVPEDDDKPEDEEKPDKPHKGSGYKVYEADAYCPWFSVSMKIN